MFDWLINFIQERFLNKSFKNIRMITSASLLFFKKKKKTVSGNGKPKLILRIFVDLQNYISTEKSRWTKYLESLLSSAKWDTTKVIQLQAPRGVLCFQTYSKHPSTIRPPVVYFLFVKLKRRWRKEVIKIQII